jgi:hypothetical protein
MSTNEPIITIDELDRALTKCEDDVILQRDRVDAHDRELAMLHKRCAKLEEAIEVAIASLRTMDAARAPRAPKASGGKITDVLGVRIMDAVRDSQLATTFTRSKVIDLFSCPPPHATRALGDLVEAGKLKLEGVKGGAKYIVVAAA